jgi:hypothetical protein
VSLIAARQENDKNILYVGVKSSFQRALLEGNSSSLYDQAILTKREVVVIERSQTAGASKGSLYAHICPSCGAPAADSLEVACPYCSSPLNSSANEWIISDVMSADEYASHARTVTGFAAMTKPDLDDQMYDVRDFAFNNILVMFGADGVFADEEKKMAERFVKKWNYSADSVTTMMNAALNGQLSIRMPLDPGKSRKIFSLMKKAASVDGSIDPKEQVLLDQIQKEYLGGQE